MPNLVGIGLSQVPTNSMLGGLAYQDPEHASIKDLDLKNLSQINSEIADTAVDIFVYDTRKDSDGGAWRKRTQHTSWYNETLNTATRGSRKEFPSVAVIVATATDVTIYDGDDPDLPMWMVFTKGTGADVHWLAADTNASVASGAISALNGTITSGVPGGAGRLTWANFISDEGYNMVHVGKYKFIGGVANRNDNLGWKQITSTITIVNRQVNDVAMTVLPNAPIDPSTGLPVPTIAVGTDGGVSIIKDDGTVVDITGTSQGSDAAIDMISFVGNDKIMYSHRYASEINTIVSSDITAQYYNQTSTWLGRISNSISHTATNVVAALSSDNNIESIALTETFAASKSVSGLSLANNYAIQNDPERKCCFITTDYNTGWMQGDIKGAFLSDTDTTNVSASTNLVTNGTFDSNNDSWNGSGISSLHNSFTTSQSSGYLIVNSNTNSGSYYGISQDVTTTTGTEYMLSFDIVSGGTGNGAVRVSDGNTATNVLSTVGGLGVGSYSFRFTSGSQSFSKVFLGRDASTNSGTNRTVYYDNIVVREATEEDRSVNNKGLQVFGTVTKSAVATGAELVSYSGWSSSNYLIQPYNSDLDFGTGDWSYMFWYNPNNAESGDVLFTRWSYNVNASLAGRIGVYFNSGNLRVDTTDDGASGYQGHFGSDGTQDSNNWHCAVILRRGSNLEIWIDGKNYKVSPLNSTSDGSYTNTSAVLEIGNSPNMGAAEAGLELALLRISKSAPSDEQIKKIYEDEKVLFQENAKATLYGSSDAVTALGYDEDTELLHVGTSAGRSDFQGLRRINNTTTAVTTAISASDDLIAEQ